MINDIPIAVAAKAAPLIHSSPHIPAAAAEPPPSQSRKGVSAMCGTLDPEPGTLDPGSDPEQNPKTAEMSDLCFKPPPPLLPLSLPLPLPLSLSLPLPLSLPLSRSLPLPPSLPLPRSPRGYR